MLKRKKKVYSLYLTEDNMAKVEIISERDKRSLSEMVDYYIEKVLSKAFPEPKPIHNEMDMSKYKKIK